MENKLVIVNPAEFGLEKTEAQKIESVFTPMLEKMVGLEKEYNVVITLPMETETIRKARELRLRYVKIRTGTDKIHETAKAYYLAGGRFVDAWRNAQKFSAINKENELEKIEKHFELIEQEKKEKLNQERIVLLQEYIPDVSFYNLKEMSMEGFNQLLSSSKLAFETQKEAERKAEEDRIAKEKADAETQKKMIIENEKLKKEAEAREKVLVKERAEQEKKLEAERAKSKAEAEAREKVEAQLRAKEEAEKELVINEKKETENRVKFEANKKYQDFLKENNYNEETDIVENNSIYRLVATFNKE